MQMQKKKKHFKMKAITRHKESCYIVLKILIQQENITQVNLHLPAPTPFSDFLFYPHLHPLLRWPWKCAPFSEHPVTYTWPHLCSFGVLRRMSALPFST